MGERRFTRCLAYARVSSVAQTDGSSLDDQRARMASHAERLGLKVARFYTEAESGGYEKIERRAEMQALLKEARSGDLILVDKTDRWSRDAEFTYRTMRELKSKGISVYFVSEQIDPSTPQGDSMLGMRVYFAHEERKRIRERMVGTRKTLRDRGLYSEGLPPMGYRRQAKKGPDKNELVIEPTEAETVREIFRLCIVGRSVEAISEALGVHRDKVYDCLHRRVYTGEMKDAEGHWIRGRHPAIVNAATFSKAQEALASRSTGSRPGAEGAATARWILRDVAVCRLCARKMSASYGGKRPGSNERHHYLACRSRCGPYVKIAEAEEDFEPLVWGRLVELRDELAGPPPARPKPLSDLKERRAKLETRRAKYIELHADGVTSRDELRSQLARLDGERLRLDAEEAVPAPPTAENRRAALKQIEAVLAAWRALDGASKRRLVARLAVSVAVGGEHSPAPVWRAAEELDFAEVAEILLQ